jgi:glycosyltransferase involved in cell wall biosynthesis
MRILIISQWYEPEPNFRTNALARSLTAKGHSVIVVTGFPNYPGGFIYPGYRIRWRQWEVRDGVRILRVPLYPSHDNSVVHRILNYLSFAFSAALLGTLLCGKIDLIWVYVPIPTSGIPALIISTLRRVPFLCEITDLWPETLFSSNIVRPVLASKILSRIIGLFNSFIYFKAAAITVISPGLKLNLIEKGVSENKIHFIPNWVDENIYHPLQPDGALASNYGFTNHFNIIFAGNIGLAQGLDNVLEAAELLRDLPKVQFIFIGSGIEQSRLYKLAKDRNLDNVKFIGQQPEDKMPYFFALADVLLVHLKRNQLFKIAIPSKIIAYLACAKPILCCAEGDAAEVVEKAQAGLSCNSQDPVLLAETVRKFFSMPAEQRHLIGEAGRRAFLGNYTQEILIERYEHLFTEILKKITKR